MNISLVEARHCVIEYVNEQLEVCHDQVISARYEVVSNYDEYDMLSLPCLDTSSGVSGKAVELYEKQEVIEQIILNQSHCKYFLNKNSSDLI